MAIKKYINNLKYILRHKWFVFLECKHIGLIWRGIMHDMSKFLPYEFGPYAEYFYGENRANFRGMHNPGTDIKFDTAWLKHIHKNPHHWQYWLLVKEDGSLNPLPMPEQYVYEMVADWTGAGRAQGKAYNETFRYDETRTWYQKNGGKMILHDETRKLVEHILQTNLK